MEKEERPCQARKFARRKKVPVRTVPKPAKWDGEFVYAFKYVCVDCSLNPEVYDDGDRKKAFEILKELSGEIWIDKTYVDFKGTRFEKTFLQEDGWNALKNLVVDTKFGKKCTKAQRAMMDKAYRQMIPGYLEMVFRDIGWDVDNMAFEVADRTGFQVEYHKDVAEEWKRYPGKWQTWK